MMLNDPMQTIPQHKRGNHSKLGQHASNSPTSPTGKAGKVGKVRHGHKIAVATKPFIPGKHRKISTEKGPHAADTVGRKTFSLPGLESASFSPSDAHQLAGKSYSAAIQDTVTSVLEAGMHHHIFRLDFQRTNNKTSLDDTSMPDVEPALALSGVHLQDAVENVLEKRELSLKTVDIFLENSCTPIPWGSDTAFLAGQVLIVKLRDQQEPEGRRSSPPSLQSLDENSTSANTRIPKGTFTRRDGARTASKATGGRKRPERLPILRGDQTDSEADKGSPIRFGSEGGRKREKSRSGISQIFPGKDHAQEKSDFLSKLCSYTEENMPKLSKLPNFGYSEHDIPMVSGALKDVMPSVKQLNERDCKQQESIWEMITTESAYINKLYAIMQMFLILIDLHTDGYLCDIDAESVFNNIEDVLSCAVQFWQIAIQPLYESFISGDAEKLNPAMCQDGFMACDDIFKPYVYYCLHRSAQVEYIRKKQKEDELFREYTAWVQRQKHFGRLEMIDVLAQPFQQIARYVLPLNQALKNTDNTASQQCLTNMIDKVKDFCTYVNDELQFKVHHDSLCSIMRSIEGYDVIESINDEADKIIRQLGSIDLTIPMSGCHPKEPRRLLICGDLKLKESNSKIEVHCFLFTDMLLICRYSGKKAERDRLRLRVIRPPYLINKLTIYELKESRDSLLVTVRSDFHVIVTAFILQGYNSSDTTNWNEQFKQAQETYRKLQEDPESCGRGVTKSGSFVSVDTPVMSNQLAVRKRSSCISDIGENADGITLTVDDSNEAIKSRLLSDSSNHSRTTSVDSWADDGAFVVPDRSYSCGSAAQLYRDSASDSNILGLLEDTNLPGLRAPGRSSSLNSEPSPTGDTSQASTNSLKPNSSNALPTASSGPRLTMHAIKKRFSPRSTRSPAPVSSKPNLNINSPRIEENDTSSPTHVRSDMEPITLPATDHTNDDKEQGRDSFDSDCRDSPIMFKRIGPHCSPTGTITSRESSQGSLETLIDSFALSNDGTFPRCATTTGLRDALQPDEPDNSREQPDAVPKRTSSIPAVLNRSGSDISHPHPQSSHLSGNNVESASSPAHVEPGNRYATSKRKTVTTTVHIVPKPFKRPPAPTAVPSNRRYERRYHTADIIEDMRPTRPLVCAPEIKKRYSWNHNTERQRPFGSRSAPQDFPVYRRDSDTMKHSASTDSFASSSGVSSSSSRNVCASPPSLEEDTGDWALVHELLDSTNMEHFDTSCDAEGVIVEQKSIIDSPSNPNGIEYWFEPGCPPTLQTRRTASFDQPPRARKASPERRGASDPLSVLVEESLELSRQSSVESGGSKEIPRIRTQAPTPSDTPGGGSPEQLEDQEFVEEDATIVNTICLDEDIQSFKEVAHNSPGDETISCTDLPAAEKDDLRKQKHIIKDEMLNNLLENKLETSNV